jgi:hypothetical protein
MTEQRLVATYLEPDLLERCQSWGLLSVALGAGIFLGCLGAWLFIKPNTKETVRIEVPPAQVVKVEVPTPVAQPAPPSPPSVDQYVPRDGPTKTSTGNPIQREVTVFSTVDHPPGSVVTGWVLKDGAAGNMPIRQYCYYTTEPPTIENPKDTTIYLGQDGTAFATTDQSLVPNYAQAVNECQWFPGTVRGVTPANDNTTFVRGRTK